ncbi:hypothetical protein [Rhizobium grahamii]|uniref:Uncharacterized protein n=1 Tax=Rhizobium grahamii CCGE 502 TaxID=990285 RepID=S3I8P2_9HYPH|nr:hypothetical protein [Rhizobium grahamii]EPE95708.1 hypothetical protein RGCCGE502_22700 [Rhizobium grahamii CCGE 502]
MTDMIVWPRDLLIPKECRPNIVPFTRTGGRSLGGVQPSIRTDLGFWTVELNSVLLDTPARLKTFEAIKDFLSGSAGRVAVPVYAFKRAPYETGAYEPPVEVPHDDNATLEDGTEYLQGAISAISVGTTAIGSTTIKIRVIKGGDDITGALFSVNHALYRIGQTLDRTGDVFTVKISPTIRELIPDGADLDFDQPTCLCNLSEDTGMNSGENIEGYEFVSLSFTEDTNYWSLLALGLI